MNETTKNLLIIGGVVFGAALIGAAVGAGSACAIHDHRAEKREIEFIADEELVDDVEDGEVDNV